MRYFATRSSGDMNKYAPHVYVIPEDDADRQIADGFVLHHGVIDAQIKVMPPAGGWKKVLQTFEDEYVPRLRTNCNAHIVMLIDFDGQVDERRVRFDQAIPEDIEPRVFVVGPKDDPETLKKALKCSCEEVGKLLAEDCDVDATKHWDHDQLRHNDAERQRMVLTVKPFLF